MRKALLAVAGRLLPFVFYVLLVVFLVLYIRSIDFGQLDDTSFAWTYVVVASILGVASRYWGSYIWLSILKGLGATGLESSNTTRELTYVYAKSWLGRYIPGTAPWILGKIYFASKHGISKNKLAVSSLLEAALQVLVTILLSFLFLGFDPRLEAVDSSIKLLMLVASVACVFFLLPAVFNKLVKTAYIVARKKHLSGQHLASNGVVMRGALLYVAGAMLSGLSFFYLSKSVYLELGYDDLMFIVGVINLAGAVGMLAIFVPSGLGVREAILLLLLGLIMPKEQALVIAIATRLWSVAIDLIFLGITSSTVKLRSGKT